MDSARPIVKQLEQVEDDISVTKFLAQSNDTTVTKFLEQAQTDIAEAKYLNMSQDPVLLKFLQQAEDDIAVTKYLFSMYLEQQNANDRTANQYLDTTVTKFLN